MGTSIDKERVKFDIFNSRELDWNYIVIYLCVKTFIDGLSITQKDYVLEMEKFVRHFCS